MESLESDEISDKKLSTEVNGNERTESGGKITAKSENPIDSMTDLIENVNIEKSSLKLGNGTIDKSNNENTTDVASESIHPSTSAPINPNNPSTPYASLDPVLRTALFDSKNRMFVLRLEKSVVSFLRSPMVQSLDLDPMNSYFRLVSHKVAEYYNIGHTSSIDGTFVIIFKQPKPLTIPHIKLSDIENEEDDIESLKDSGASTPTNILPIETPMKKLLISKRPAVLLKKDNKREHSISRQSSASPIPKEESQISGSPRLIVNEVRSYTPPVVGSVIESTAGLISAESSTTPSTTSNTTSISTSATTSATTPLPSSISESSSPSSPSSAPTQITQSASDQIDNHQSHIKILANESKIKPPQENLNHLEDTNLSSDESDNTNPTGTLKGLSFEAKVAAYEEARARIFKNFVEDEPPSENPPPIEQSTPKPIIDDEYSRDYIRSNTSTASIRNDNNPLPNNIYAYSNRSNLSDPQLYAKFASSQRNQYQSLGNYDPNVSYNQSRTGSAYYQYPGYSAQYQYPQYGNYQKGTGEYQGYSPNQDPSYNPGSYFTPQQYYYQSQSQSQPQPQSQLQTQPQQYQPLHPHPNQPQSHEHVEHSQPPQPYPLKLSQSYSQPINANQSQSKPQPQPQPQPQPLSHPHPHLHSNRPYSYSRKPHSESIIPTIGRPTSAHGFKSTATHEQSTNPPESKKNSNYAADFPPLPGSK